MAKEEIVLKENALNGFPRGWVIFMIVYASAAFLSMIDDTKRILIFGLFLAGMIIGLSLMLKKLHYGFWILLASSILLTLINGIVIGHYTIISSGGLVLVFLTWLFTRKQINYQFWKSKNG